jgi:hypothetical protein
MDIRVTRINAALAAAAMTVLAAPACAAGANPAVAAFAQLCGATKADFAAVAAAADAGGWKRTSESGDAPMEGVNVTEHMTRVSKAGDSLVSMTAWSGTAKGGVTVSACTVHVAKTEFGPILADAQVWTGFPAQESTPASAKFRFSDAAEGRHALAKNEFDAAAAGPGLEILTVSTEGHGAILDLLKVKK